MSLGNLVKFIPSARQATLLLALSNIFLEKVPAAPQQGQEAAQEEPKVRKEVTELCQLLSHQELAEVLKWPFTVGEAEKIVLTELERQTGQTFDGDVWKFVEQAQSLGITGLDAPAKRPALKIRNSIEGKATWSGKGMRERPTLQNHAWQSPCMAQCSHG